MAKRLDEMLYRWSKGDYQSVAEVCHEIEQGLVALGYDLPARNDILELITARFASMFAQDNPRFDSFRFVEAARKRHV